MNEMEIKALISNKKIVDKVTEETQRFILKKLKAKTARQRWLLYSRIVNNIFSIHYQCSMSLADSKIINEEAKK